MDSKAEYKKIQKKYGRKGGKATFKKYGREHFVRLGKRGGEKNAKRLLEAKK